MSLWFYLPMKHDIARTFYYEIHQKDNSEGKVIKTYNMVEAIVTHNKKQYR